MKRTGRRIKMKKLHRRGFFLKCIKPSPGGSKGEVAWPPPRRYRNERCSGRGELAARRIEGENIDPVLAQIRLQNKAISRGSLDHMSMRLVVAADSKAAGGPAFP